MDTDERSWETIAADSVLMNAVSSWRKDPEKWLENSIDRLNEPEPGGRIGLILHPQVRFQYLGKLQYDYLRRTKLLSNWLERL